MSRRTHHGLCPVAGCTRALPNANAIVCADHYFCVPADQMRAAIRMRVKANRTGHPAFVEQADKHAAAIVKSIETQRRRVVAARTEHSHA